MCISVLLFMCADLNYLEETAGGPNLTLATLPKSKRIVLVQARPYILNITPICIRFENRVYTPYHDELAVSCLLLTQMDSRLHADYLEQVMNTALTGIARVHTILDSTVKEHLQKTVGAHTIV